MTVQLPCPVCKEPATHEVRWTGTDDVRVYCQKHASEVGKASVYPTSMRRLATDG